MLSAIVENEITKEKEYLYLKQENNNLLYYGFSIQNCNIKPIDKNIINKIYDLLKVNEACVYIEDYLDYKVYLDKENNIKHYLKDGVEDFVMLFKNNGEDLNLYSNIDDLNDPDFEDFGVPNRITDKKFKMKNFTLKLAKSFCYAVIIPRALFAINLVASNVSDKTIEYGFSKLVYSVSDCLNLDLNYVDYNDAIDFIKSSTNLTEEQKEILCNESLLKDVFEYYKGTDMEYIVKNRLDNIKTQIYPEDDYKKGIIDENYVGYYNELSPNVIHLREDIKDDNTYNTFKHEFVHLLQSKYKYRYITEATAEIISYEYMDAEIDSYEYAVENIRLLMDVIGPKAIWETVFSGDDTNLINILNTNLNESEAKELISYLKQRPQDVDNQIEQERIPEIIFNLYRNINLKDIKDNENIYDSDGNHVDKIYFNEDKLELSINEALENHIVKWVDDYKKVKEISKDRYIELKEKLDNNLEYQKIKKKIDLDPVNAKFYEIKLNNIRNVKFDIIPQINGVEIIDDDLFNGCISKDGEIINIQDAIEKKLIHIQFLEKISDSCNLSGSEIGVKFGKTIKVKDENFSVVYDEDGVIKGVVYNKFLIKDMFPDQTIRSNNNNMTK